MRVLVSSARALFTKFTVSSTMKLSDFAPAAGGSRDAQRSPARCRDPSVAPSLFSPFWWVFGERRSPGEGLGVWRRRVGVAHHTPATASPVEADVDSTGRNSPRGRRRARRAPASQSERSQRPVPPTVSPPPPQHAAAAPPGPPAAPAALLAAPAHPKGLSERQRWPLRWGSPPCMHSKWRPTAGRRWLQWGKRPKVLTRAPGQAVLLPCG